MKIRQKKKTEMEYTFKHTILTRVTGGNMFSVKIKGYDDLVYKLKKLLAFERNLLKIISHYKKIGCNINVLRQTA